MRTPYLIPGICCLVFPSFLAVQADDWPQWRGPQRTGVSAETGLLKEWPEKGPAQVWQVDTVGVGFSSLAVKDGRVITQGDLDGVEHIIAYDEKDGKLLWAVQPEPVVAALVKKIESEFERMDKDKDGQLDELEALGGLGQNFYQFDVAESGNKDAIAKTRAAKLIKALDKDGNGMLAYAELNGPMQGLLEKIDEESKTADGPALADSRAQALLDAADADLDGKISKPEAKGSLAERIFDRADAKVAGTDKGDGQLTKQELSGYFFAREPGRDGDISGKELEAYYVKNQAGIDGILTKADIRRYYGGYRNGFGDGPRGTPTIEDNRVYVEGGFGDLSCLDAATGKTLWHVNLTEKFRGGRPGWGYSESPLIVNDLVIVTPGGADGTIAALNKNTGDLVWRSSDLKQGAHYSSPMFAEIAGVPQIVQFANQSVFGVTLNGGKLLWSYDGSANGTANISTPTIFGDHVLSSSGYGKGAGLVKVTNVSTDEQKAEEIYYEKKLSNHHGGIIKVGDHVYGFGGALVCMNFLTGEIVWQERSVGKGSVIAADGMLYLLGENAEVGLAEATPEGYREHGRFKIDNFSKPAWAHPVVANGKLFLRNMHRLTAYDIKAN